MIEFFSDILSAFLSPVEYASEHVQNFLTGIPDFINWLFSAIQNAVLGFLTDSHDKFVSIGSSFANAIGFGDFSIITDNFFFWICGIFIGIWILKFVITAVVELVSKLLDPL